MFRSGVGMVLYTQAGDIALFSRADQPMVVWQFPQGGWDMGETVEAALWRELQEETGLTKDQISKVDAYPGLLYYEYPTEGFSIRCPNALGQIHQWYFLALRDGVAIDLASAPDQEFAAVRFGSFKELLGTPSFKSGVYEQLADYFERHVWPR